MVPTEPLYTALDPLSRKRPHSAISSIEPSSHHQLFPLLQPYYTAPKNIPQNVLQNHVYDAASSQGSSSWNQPSSYGFVPTSVVPAQTLINPLWLMEPGHFIEDVSDQTYNPYVSDGLPRTTAAPASLQPSALFDVNSPPSSMYSGSIPLSYPVSTVITPTAYPTAVDVSSAAIATAQTPYLEAEGSRLVPWGNAVAGNLQHSQLLEPSEGLPRAATEKPSSAKSNVKSKPHPPSHQHKKRQSPKNRTSQNIQKPTWSVQLSKPQLNNNGQVVGLNQVVMLAPIKRPKRERSSQERLNRLLGACSRHHDTHKSVCSGTSCALHILNDYGQCDLSCFPYLRCAPAMVPGLFRLQDIRFFRYGPAMGHPLETNRNELFKLEDIQGPVEEPTTVCLTQDIGHMLAIDVAKFVPRSGDKLKHTWFRNGEKRELAMPSYYLANLTKTRHAILQYINATVCNYLDMVIEDSGDITKAILLRAVDFAKKTESSMVQDVLNLLAINRMIERDWRIVGPETLGLSPVNEEDCPWYNTIPATPMMDTGLDQIVIKDYLEQRREHVLSELEKRLGGKVKQDRFEILLTMFVLEKNMELLLQHSRHNAMRYHAPKRYNCIELAQEYFRGHNVLLSYFHIFMKDSSSRKRKCCGKLVVPTGSSFSPDQVIFLSKIQELISNQAEHARRLREQKRYEEELHWSHQLFETEWQPDSLEIEDER